MGGDRSLFEEAVSTGYPGLYTCKLSHAEIVFVPLPVESAMHVSIVGDYTMPQWSFTGEGPTFTVAVHAHLNLAYIRVPGGQVSSMRGSEVSIDHVQMQGTQLHVAGSLAVSNSQLVDVQFDTESAAVVTMDTVTVSRTGAGTLSLSIGCSVTIRGSQIRSTELQVASDGELILISTSIYMEGRAVSVAIGGSFTVSASKLVHGETTDPFPCNGANRICTGQHTGSVMIAGPASINTAAMLVCADETAGSCLSDYMASYPDIQSCLAAIPLGVESCFVNLQQDAMAVGTVAAFGGQHFEVHGDPGQEIQLQAFWTVSASASVTLADLCLVTPAGSVTGYVESGGKLTLRGIRMQDAGVAFSGTVLISNCTLVNSQLVGSGAASSLTISGGTATGSTLTLFSGTATLTNSAVLTNSPIIISMPQWPSYTGVTEETHATGVTGRVSPAVTGGTLAVSGCEFQSDGATVPLTVESGGTATVTSAVFRGTAGDITAVSVAAGGSLTVDSSQLVGADGSADPFPCDGTLPDCAGQHAGSVTVAGPSAINTAAPLVCDAVTGA